MRYLTLLFPALAVVRAWSEDMMTKYVDYLDLVADFIPNVPENKLAHHVRTPFAISKDGKTLHVAYTEGSRWLADSKMKVHVQALDPSNFDPVGFQPCTIDGAKEASGLVSLDDGGFVILISMDFTTSRNDPEEHDIPVVARYDKDCKPVWMRPVGGKTVPMVWIDAWPQPAWFRAPRLDGDLAHSPENRTYAAMFRTEFYGYLTGHGGDIVVYIDDSEDKGQIMVQYGTQHNHTEMVTETVSKKENLYSIVERCPHDFGLALAPADVWPFPAVCTNDHGALYLMTDRWLGGGYDMVVGEYTQPEQFAGEAFGGVHGSYSALARASGEAYLVTYVSRPTISHSNITDMCTSQQADPNKCGGTGFCNDTFRQCNDDVKPRNVRVLLLDNKIVNGTPLTNPPGDDWKYEKPSISITPYRDNVDCSNARIATFDRDTALLTWEEEEVSQCQINTGCKVPRKYTGTSFQKLDAQGNPLETAFKSTDVFVSGDIIQVSDQMCWPYVHMDWNTSWDELRKYPMQHDTRSGELFFITRKLSFACMQMTE